MTEEERRLLTEDEDTSRLLAFFHFRRALQCAGVPVRDMEIVEKNGDRIVEVTFMNGYVAEANITMDSVPTAMWDCLKQIPALRERG